MTETERGAGKDSGGGGGGTPPPLTEDERAFLYSLQRDLAGPVRSLVDHTAELLELGGEGCPAAVAADLERIAQAGRLLHTTWRELRDFDALALKREERGAALAGFTRHELRTPVNALIGYGELIQEELDDLGRPEGSAIIAEEVEVLVATAKRFLPYLEEAASRSEAMSERPKGENDPRDDSLVQHLLAKTRHPFPPGEHPAGAAAGRILVMEDNPMNRELVRRQLEREGYEVEEAADGQAGFERLREGGFDLVLVDLLMPGMSGLEVLESMKDDPVLCHVPVLMVSAHTELEGIVRCIEMGADDYLTKPIVPVLLKARIGACLEKKRLRDREQITLRERDAAYRALLASQEALQAELEEADRYVRSLLPPRLTSGPVLTDWAFLTSTELGGDAFGYHWIDERHFALFVLDVCGHGVGAALLSVSAMDAISSRRMEGGVDFMDPGSVLGALNREYDMEKHNQMYFTIWYGVYDAREKELAYACAGHPPAMLLPASGEAPPSELKPPGTVIGFSPDATFETARTTVAPGDRLYLFSDGIYEIERTDGEILGFDDFMAELARPAPAPVDGDGVPPSKVDALITWARRLQGGDDFVDDVSLVEVTFAAGEGV